MQVYCSQKLEESNTMLGELCEVLIDHVECRLKDCLKDRWNLRREQILERVSSTFSSSKRRYLRPAVK